MQPNTITLAVDELNDSTTVDHTFTRYEEFQNRSVYIGESHDISLRDTLSLYRSFPKQSGNYRGTAKTSVKFTTDVSVVGVDGIASIVSPLILEVSFSVPVGVTPAQLVLARQRAIALLDTDTVMTSLNSTLMI